MLAWKVGWAKEKRSEQRNRKQVQVAQNQRIMKIPQTPKTPQLYHHHHHHRRHYRRRQQQQQRNSGVAASP